MVKEQGPMLIASNHPNSFLDAIIMASLFKSPIYSLARGDAFIGKFTNKILTSLNMLPVYRVSEGVENLENNYTTFNACINLFKESKIVLIFSEGRCINEWHLRPLKKGTARLAISAWENKIPLKVLPLGINYSSFRLFGKNMILNFGKFITQKDLDESANQGFLIKEFNNNLYDQLVTLVYEIEASDQKKRKNIFLIKQSLLKRIVLFIPAIFGFVLHAPLYLVTRMIIRNRAKDHFDSIMTGVLFLFYPVYLILATLILFLLSKSVYSLLLFFVMPFTAWSYLQIKRQI